ncbi:hypothetical protein [Gluconobacter thailandicus]|uniref:Uncharacterized protein n=1 Tax=Gluconobacter thailandicus TaxID=257438 RepID=A0AAP9ETW2_GLUTH|nr:hypothetical protein [Gluconobacter thailandicus]QEH97079.1 hypothetical protein FXF46_13105 [Gluconobacter thailandicus]
MEKRWVLLTIVIVLTGLIMLLLWSRQTDPGTTGPDTHTEKTAPQALNMVAPYPLSHVIFEPACKAA